ncbi:MAG: glycosyltransferase family 2 protein [Dinoroseobacter sp.]|nr:glycosyltransferase family 2 protein [Dinoroseobacter sp.]
MTKTAAIAIGRNEGARLHASLDSLKGVVDDIVYVDSGSTDGSLAAATDRGALVVKLDTSVPFTAARARNAGIARLSEGVAPEFVQVLDGDCILQPGWLETARSFLTENPTVAVACGRRRERFPEASVWNRLIDAEWDTPVGEAKACGGDALIRWSALQEVGGYRDDLIAGEEPEMCVRLRAKGWKIWRLDAEMTLHDAAMTRFGQWWKRSKRAGHAFAEGAALHGSPPERHYVRETRRALVWGAVLPAATVLAAFVSPGIALGLLLLWPLQAMRLRARGLDWAQAIFMTLCKLPEAQGVLLYHWRHRRGIKTQLIEYK